MYISLSSDKNFIVDTMAKKFNEKKCDAVDNYFYEGPKSQIQNSLCQETMPKDPPENYVADYFHMQVDRRID